MKVAKSLFTLPMAVALLAAASCSTDSTSGGSSGGSSGGKAIDVFVAAHKKGFKDAVKAFEKANPDAAINFSYAPTDSYVTTMRTRLSSGSAPDVFYVYPGQANAMAMYNLTASGYLADLSDTPWVSRIPDSIAPITQDDGKTYILPMTYDAIGALYNVDAFNKVGVDVPKTWSDVIAFCHKAKEKGLVPFALGNQTSTDTQFLGYALVSSIVYPENPNFAKDMQKGKATFAGSGWETVFKKQLEMREAGCFNKHPNGTSFDAAISMVATGKAVAFVGVTPQTGEMKLKNEDAEFGLFPMPGTNDPDDLRLSAAPGVGVGVNAKSDQLELAKKFVNFLAKPKNANAFVEGRGSLPAIPNDKFEVSGLLKPVVKYRKMGKVVQWPGQTWPNAKIQPAHLAGVQNLFAGKITPHELCKKMDQAYRSG